MPLMVPLLALVAVSAGCGSPAPSSLPEWTPADHDRTEETARAATQQAPSQKQRPRQSSPPTPPNAAGGGAPSTPRSDPLLEATWAQQCATCHGALGHGDGPTGPMVHAADLTLASWQAGVTDDEMANVITNGNGKMPKFPDLPPKIVLGLVGRIRSLKGR